MVHLGSKELFTNRLILRKLRESDAEMMFNNWCTDSEVTRYLRWLPHKSIVFTRSLLKDWINSYGGNESYLWGIELKESKQLIGTISVVDIDKLEIGYALSKNMWGKGIMTEALGRVIKFLFEEVGAKKIVSCHDILNPASGNVMLKAGMKYIENKKNYYISPFGENVEVAQYEIVNNNLVNESAQKLWRDYLISENAKISQEDEFNYDCWQFGESPDELADLVFRNIKKATASLYHLYEKNGNSIPQVGDYSVILNSKNEAVCIIKIVNTNIKKFKDVDENFAFKEGERDKTLISWKKIHQEFFSRYIKDFNVDMEIFLEEFEMVYSKLEK